jgi:hypothetical protein
MAERQRAKETGAGETEDRPPMTAAQFEATPEFRRFKSAMRKILRVPKSELDERVRQAKETSPRFGNPNAPGRKKQ